MVQVEINNQTVEDRLRALAALSVNRPVIRKYIRDCVRKELQKVRKFMAQDAKSNMESDPRQSFRAVKYTVYKHVLGGNVSILNPRKAGARYKLVKERLLDRNPKQVGGNRRSRSDRTEQVDSYFGKDRAFILRFQNSGTKSRMTRFGNRGQIPGRNWFEMSALFQMEVASENLSNLIEDILAEEFEKENN